MKYTVEQSLTNFPFWSGAADRAKELTYDELDKLDDILPDYFGDEVTDTDINDMFWFEFETIVHALGYAYIDGKIVRDEDDIPEEMAKDKLKEYLDDNTYDYTSEQFDALYQRCVEEGDVFKLDADNDDVELDETFIEDYAKDVGMKVEDED